MTTPTTPSHDLRALADAFWEQFLASYPTWATVVGDRRFDDRLDDPSQAGVAARLAWLTRSFRVRRPSRRRP